MFFCGKRHQPATTFLGEIPPRLYNEKTKRYVETKDAIIHLKVNGQNKFTYDPETPNYPSDIGRTVVALSVGENHFAILKSADATQALLIKSCDTEDEAVHWCEHWRKFIV